MNNPTSKPIIKRQEETVFERPKKKGDQSNFRSLKEAFAIETLEKNPWGQFLLFIEEKYKDFTPRPHEELAQKAKIIQNAIRILIEHHQESWGEILSIIPQSEKAEADEFYQEISRYKRLTPQEVYQASQTAIKVIINHDKYGFVDGKIDAERINRKTQLNEAIDYFHNNQDKTYFIIAQLPELVPEDAKPMFAASKAFQEIIAAGSNFKLEEFSMALMRRFRLTRADIKDDYAQFKDQEKDQIERDLRTQINILQQEKLALEEQLEKTRNQARQEAVIAIANALQNGRQPALNQIQQMISLLESQVEETGEPELDSDQALTVFIILRNLMKIFQELGIESYPKSLKGKLQISQNQLSEYAYIEGNPFANEEEIKQVECTQPGWKVGETVITPAKVRELNSDQ
jgi:molecular chaperone GrpE (heat shock protein)